MDEERFFTMLADTTDTAPATSERAPARLKARLYSAIVAKLGASGPLRSLPATKTAGRNLCVFETLLGVIPDEQIQSMNPCRVCHARLLAERFESPPIYWPHCPYVEFQSE